MATGRPGVMTGTTNTGRPSVSFAEDEPTNSSTDDADQAIPDENLDGVGGASGVVVEPDAVIKPNKPNRHAIVVGEPSIGKTQLVKALRLQNVKLLPSIYEENHIDEQLTLDFYDGIGFGYEQIKNQHEICTIQSYKTMVVCFAINDRSSFKCIKSIWKDLLNLHCFGSIVILVGLKVDTRRPNDKTFVKRQEGFKMAQKIKANAYIETSVKKDINIEKLVHTIMLINVQQYWNHKKKEQQKQKKDAANKTWFNFWAK